MLRDHSSESSPRRRQSLAMLAIALCLAAATKASGAPQSDGSIPDLGIPTGALSRGKTGSNGEGFSNSVIWIATQQTLGDVSAYYQSKLSELGWRHSRDFSAKDLVLSRFVDVAGSDATVGTLGVMPLASGQVVVWIRRARSSPPATSSGRKGGGGASAGEKVTNGLPIDFAVKNLFGMAPIAPSNERMADLQALPAAFPKELIHPRFTATRIVGSSSRTTVAGVIQNAASSDATVLLSIAKKAGWIEYPLAGGFFTGRIAMTVCRGASEAALGFDELPNRVLVAMASVGTGGSRCVQAVSYSPSFTTPWLSVPEQWWSPRTLGGGSRTLRQSQARLDVVAPATVFAHFDQQLLAAGYTKGTSLGDGLELIARYSSAPGQPAAIVVLSVQSIPGGKQVDALLDVFDDAGR